MSTQMPSRICKGDKVRLKKDEARKYGGDEDTVWSVERIDKIGSTPRLYVTRPRDGQSDKIQLFWARDCVLAWGKSSKERREALGL